MAYGESNGRVTDDVT